ncbi:Translation initiation factor IF-2 [Labeo rohita]|uniref:Translation initiation factor IF-2 n=1 Tax=Labeo rohita TaxID=84645 RepID=A0ABQ8MJA2_LABRO|nr:Translation initiation factor IF-2 [Labeo rohita]
MSIPSRSLPFPPSTLRSRLFLFLVPTLFLILSSFHIWLPLPPPPGSLCFGDPSLSTTSTLEHIPSSAARPRPLVRQQSLQQPLTHQPPPGPNDPPATSQSLGQLHTGPGGGGHRGGPRGVRGSPAGAGASRYRSGGGARSRSNPGSWDHVMGQIRNRGMDVKSFL